MVSGPSALWCSRTSRCGTNWVVKGDLTIQFVPQVLTSYCGLELLGRYLRQIDLGARLRQTFAGLRSDHGSARIALVLLALRQAWSANGSLEDEELMAKREVLKRDGGGTGQEGAQEGPETDRENHRRSRHEA